jgi:hypothetical protein
MPMNWPQLGARAVLLLLLLQGLALGISQLRAGLRAPGADTPGINAALAASLCRGGVAAKPVQPR